MSASEAIYVLCAVTSLVTAGLLLRTYLRRRTPLLLWSCVSFACLAVNNVLVYLDLVLFKAIDLSGPRAITGAVGMMVLLVGLIWEGEA
jgi:hypothetical protein